MASSTRRIFTSIAKGVGSTFGVSLLIKYSADFVNRPIDTQLYDATWDSKIIFLLAFGALSTGLTFVYFRYASASDQQNERTRNRINNLSSEIKGVEGRVLQLEMPTRPINIPRSGQLAAVREEEEHGGNFSPPTPPLSELHEEQENLITPHEFPSEENREPTGVAAAAAATTAHLPESQPALR